MSGVPKPVEVFLSYAKEDEWLCKELEKHLSLLQRQGQISAWHPRLITAGINWSEAIDTHLNTASVIFLLISSDFMASKYSDGKEVQRAMQRYEHDSARVIPILLRPCDWQDASFGKLQALPSNGMPVTSWANVDEAFTDDTDSYDA